MSSYLCCYEIDTVLGVNIPGTPVSLATLASICIEYRVKRIAQVQRMLFTFSLPALVNRLLCYSDHETKRVARALRALPSILKVSVTLSMQLPPAVGGRLCRCKCIHQETDALAAMERHGMVARATQRLCLFSLQIRSCGNNL